MKVVLIQIAVKQVMRIVWIMAGSWMHYNISRNKGSTEHTESSKYK